MLTETLGDGDRNGKWVDCCALSDEELESRVTQLTKQKRALDAELLLYLAELDRRKLCREHACPSLFDFCVRRLGFSEDVAYKRVGAARLVRRFPFVHTLLADGRLHLTGLMLVAPHLTEENHREWLLAATGKSKREIEKLVATRRPKPDVPSCIRKLPESRGHSASLAVEPPTSPAPPSSGLPSAIAPAAIAPAAIAPAAIAPASISPAPLAVGARPSSSRSTTAPLSESTYRVVFTVSESLKQKLDRARELTSHAVPPSDLPGLIERAVDLLIASEERRRCATSSRVTARAAKAHAAKAHVAKAHVAKAHAPKAHATADHRSQGHQEVASPEELAPIEPQQDPDLVRGRPDGTMSSVQAHLKSIAPTEACPQLVVPPRFHSPSDLSKSPNLSKSSNLPKSSRLPKSSHLPKSSRHVPASERRLVWRRDGAQCTYVDADGRRCPCRHFLQLDHIVPYALGGPQIADNLRLRCATHNRHWAEEVFGRAKVEAAILHARCDK